jgi:hypothetical protein
VSQHLRYDPATGPGPVAEAANANREAGLEMAIVYLPTPHDPAVLEPLASALSELN